MPAAFRQLSVGRSDIPLQRRIATMALVAALHALLLFLLLRLTPTFAPKPPPAGPLTVELLPEGKTEEVEKANEEEKKPSERAKQAAAAPPKRPASPITTAPASDIWSKIVPLRGSDFAASDIAKMPKSQGDGQGEGEATADAGGGGGPNGERLYDADWYRKPSDAELANYIPSGAPRNGWGMIACRTVPDFRVEDCQEIGQSPAGSGLARAVRLAAWQFRVRPPRIGGRPLVGAWVRIRIDYTEVRQP